MNDGGEQLGRRVSQALNTSDSERLRIPTGLARRAIAEGMSRTDGRREVRFWKFVAGLSGVTAVAAVALSLAPQLWTQLNGRLSLVPTTVDASLHSSTENVIFPRDRVEGRVKQPLVLRMGIDADSDAVFAEVKLSDGVNFYRRNGTGPAPERSLLLSLEEAKKQSRPFPVVLISDLAGSKAVEVRFLDKDKRTIAERTVNVRFSP